MVPAVRGHRVSWVVQGQLASAWTLALEAAEPIVQWRFRLRRPFSQCDPPGARTGEKTYVSSVLARLCGWHAS